MRLFAAILPPEDVLEHVEVALRTARASVGAVDSRGPVRWTEPSDRHLTLAFYGEVPDGAVAELADLLARRTAGTGELELRLRGAGVFDRRTLWIGVGGEVERWSALSATCVEVGEQVTGRAENRVRSRPHLTIGRVRSHVRRDAAAARRRGPTGRGRTGTRALGRVPPALPEVTDLVRALSVYEGPTWRAHEVALVRSRPGEGRGGGPLYEVVDRARLS